MDIDQVGVRVTEDEKMAWQTAAERLGITLSDLVRESVRAYLGKTQIARETLERIRNEIEAEFAPKLQEVEAELAATKGHLESLSSYLHSYDATIRELEEKEKAEADPEVAAKLLDEIARLKNRKNVAMERIEEAVARIKKLERDSKNLLKEKDEAFEAALRRAFPSVAEPLLERLAIDICDVVEALKPFLAAYKGANAIEKLNWLRIRTAMVCKEKSPEAWMFLGKPMPLYYEENYATWKRFWNNFWQRYAV